MCACGCFLIVGIAFGLVYLAIHALWLPFVAVVIFAALIGWFGRKSVGPRT